MLCLFIFSSPYLLAQNDAESQSRVEISVVIKPNILISEINDIDLVVEDRTQDFVFNQDFCVTGNTQGNYSIRAALAQELGASFALIDENGVTLPFKVSFSGNRSNSAAEPLVYGQDSSEYPLLGHDTNCDGNPNARLTLEISSEDLLLSQASLYQGELSLTVTTE